MQEHGQVLGPYRLERLIGTGGVGEVWRAHDTIRGREVALKLLHRDVGTDEELRERFRREARIAARLNSPHALPIHDFGELEGRLYLDMRLVEGPDLSRLLLEGPPTPEVGVDLVAQIADVLDEAHRLGLVHRDVKPSNVLLAGDPPFAYLSDFGVAIARSELDSRLTASRGLLGTPAYLAPERFEGDGRLDHRVDVYSLGCVLYEVLTSRRPFAATDAFRTMAAHLHQAPPRPSEDVPELGTVMDEVVATAMAKDPAARYGSAGQLARAAAAALRAGRVRAPGIASASDGRTRGPVPTNRGAGTPPDSPLPPAGPRTTEPGFPEPEDITLVPPRPVVLRVRDDYRTETGPLPHDAPFPLLAHQAAVDRLRRRLQHAAGGATLLTGLNGAGKTTVVRRALVELDTALRASTGEPRPVIAVSLSVATTTTPYELLARLLGALAAELERLGLTARVEPATRHILAEACRRASMSMTTTSTTGAERTLGIGVTAGFVKAPGVTGKRTTTTAHHSAYLPYDRADAERDVIRVATGLGPGGATRRRPAWWRRRREPWTGRVVVVVDELDKLTAESAGIEALEELLGPLKNVLTSSGVHFVLVAGADVRDAVRTARARGRGIWEDVFGNHDHLACLPLGGAAELLRAVLIDAGGGRGVADLAAFLEYRSRGLPRQLLRELDHLVQWRDDSPVLVVDPDQAVTIAFYADLLRRLGPLWARSRVRGPTTDALDLDRRRATVHDLVDRALARSGSAFTATDLLTDTADATETARARPVLDGLVEVGILAVRDAEGADRTLAGLAVPTEPVFEIAPVVLRSLRQVATPPPDLGRFADGRYVLQAELGRGALGHVYRAVDDHLGMQVVVKVLDLPEHERDYAARARFRRESALVRRLDHPCLATVHDVVDDRGQLGLVVEYIGGQSIADLLRDGPAPPTAAVRVAGTLAELVQYLADQGVVRVDLKPSNIVVRPDGRPVLVEIGRARSVHHDGPSLTAAGEVIGTPLYLAPEQLRGSDGDVRSAVYSLGLLLWEMLTARPARSGDAAAVIRTAALERLDPEELSVSPELRQVLRAMLEPHPADRPHRADEVAVRLAAVPEQERPAPP